MSLRPVNAQAADSAVIALAAQAGAETALGTVLAAQVATAGYRDETQALKDQTTADAVATAADALATGADRTAVAADRVLAENARAGAEDARDSAVAHNGLYADTAAGIAATADGQGFAIPSASTYGYADLYTNVGGVATAQNKSLPTVELITDSLARVAAVTSVTAIASNPELLNLRAVKLNDPTKRLGVQYWVRDTAGARLIARFVDLDTAALYYLGEFGNNPDPTTHAQMGGGTGVHWVDIYDSASTTIGQALVHIDGGGTTWGAPTPFTPADVPIAVGPQGFSQTEQDAIAAVAEVSAAPALDYVAEFGSAFDPTSTAIPEELSSRVKRIYLENGKAHDLSITRWRFSDTVILLDVYDEVIGDQVGVFELVPDYNDLPDRIPLVALDPLSTLPAGDPDAAQASPLRGYVELHDGVTSLGDGVVGGNLAAAQPPAGEVRINRRNVKNRLFAAVAHPLLRDFAEVIEAGPARTLADARAAVDTLLDVPQPTDGTVTYAPTSKRATIGHQIAVLLDPANLAVPGAPWLDDNLFWPDNVSLIARYPNSVFFEHPPGATRPIFQWFGNHLVADINVKNTEPEGTLSSTSSARYAHHLETTHSILTEYPQSDDYTQDFKFTILRGSSTVGVNAGVQPIGCAIPANTTVEILDHDLFCENPSYAGPLIAANTSSLTLGGGRLIVRNTRDLTGRDQSDDAVVDNSTVAVQTKLPAAPYPNELILESNLHFGKIALTGSAGTAGMWKLRGGNYQGHVYSDILDSEGALDRMGYV